MGRREPKHRETGRCVVTHPADPTHERKRMEARARHCVTHHICDCKHAELEMAKAQALRLTKENERLKANWSEFRRAFLRAAKENEHVRTLAAAWIEGGR